MTASFYHTMDPAGRRNPFMLWGAVTPNRDLYVLREWPNVIRVGDGPYGLPVGPWVTPQGRIGDGQTRGAGLRVGEMIKLIRGVEKDLAARLGMSDLPVISRAVDKRFAKTPTTATAERGDNLIDHFAGGDGQAPMYLTPALTAEVDTDITKINDWLAYDPEQPIVRGINRPRMHICDECQNLLWSLQNWEWRGAGDGSGHAALKDPLKDPIDALRMLVAQDLIYLPPDYTGGRPPEGF